MEEFGQLFQLWPLGSQIFAQKLIKKLAACLNTLYVKRQMFRPKIGHNN